MANEALGAARENKNDEFYTQYEDIQKEINAYLEYDPDTFRDKTVLLPCDDPEWSNFTRFFAQNFDRLGLKKLISTSYATESKQKHSPVQISIFEFLTEYEKQSPQYDEKISPKRGKIFTLTRRNKKIDINDLQWEYLDGDGDFRSEEVKKLRDEADIIVTNPPFSLFRQFVAWIYEAQKDFLIIGNQNAITYKEFFPYLKENKAWIGASDCLRWFLIHGKTDMKTKLNSQGEVIAEAARSRWFTNLDHGRRHQPLPLMTMADNLKFSKHKEIKEQGYLKYDNYDAIEVPYTDAIPSDYDGVMGVPITFLDKYCPEQFEIIWLAAGNTRASAPKEILAEVNYRKHEEDRGGCPVINGQRTYGRVLVRAKR